MYSDRLTREAEQKLGGAPRSWHDMVGRIIRAWVDVTLDSWVASATGLGINLVLAAQNLAQLDTVWRCEMAETIAFGPRVRMFGPGLADPQTLTYIERLGGQTAVLQDQVSRSPYLRGLQNQPLDPRALAADRLPADRARATRLHRPDLLRQPPPFTVHWRSRDTDAHLAAKSRLPPRRQSREEIDFLTTAAEDRRLNAPTPPRARDIDVDAIPRGLNKPW
jgi:type IV secretory system conjugative DNA transfer VirD4/TraG family protein